MTDITGALLILGVVISFCTIPIVGSLANIAAAINRIATALEDSNRSHND